MTIHPHPHLKPLYSKRFLQSTSTSLLIINPLHSRVAHRSFDYVLFTKRDAAAIRAKNTASLSKVQKKPQQTSLSSIGRDLDRYT